MTLSELYNYADRKNIKIECYDFKQIQCASVCVNDNCYIAINPFNIETYADEKVKLAHEIGHCEAGSFYNKYSPLDIREKHEYAANKWSINKLIPKDELANAILNGYTECWELAEIFEVTCEFMYKAMEFYENDESFKRFLLSLKQAQSF